MVELAHSKWLTRLLSCPGPSASLTSSELGMAALLPELGMAALHQHVFLSSDPLTSFQLMAISTDSLENMRHYMHLYYIPN